MNALQAKLKEVAQSVIPVVIYVAILILIFVPVEPEITIRFLLGALLLFLGLSIFLWGVDQSMDPIGGYMAKYMTTAKSVIAALFFAFFLGFLITAAEPSLRILGQQVESASGGMLEANFLVIIVSVGVGLMIAVGALRTLFNGRLNVLMAIIYMILAVMGIFVSEEFLAIAFDASGATTGALTTPFILALSLGLAKAKGGKEAEANSFGLVGVMSAGPILTVMLLAIITGQSDIRGTPEPFVITDGILGPIHSAIRPTFLESLGALLPITILFFILNGVKFKIPRKELLGIIRGLIYTLIGMTLFLVGANAGFMDMGRLLGKGLAENYSHLLPLMGFILGFIVLSAEPAVHVLGKQVEEVTAGHIPVRVIRMTLSIGVGLAVALSMVRIMTPEIKLWYFLLPGFALSILLSFYVDDIFTGIAYDAGGVASGPLSATFILAFAQGVADAWPTADVLSDGFGVIAMIAMTPIVSVMVLGSLYKFQQKKKVKEVSQPIQEAESKALAITEVQGRYKDLVVAVVDHGLSEEIVNLGRGVGAGGATIFHGRDEKGKAWSAYSLDLDPEKEMIFFIVSGELTNRLCNTLLDKDKNPTYRTTTVFVLPIDGSAGLRL